MKLKKGDTVEVITGKDKGKQGEIEHVYPKTNKIIVTGVNRVAPLMHSISLYSTIMSSPLVDPCQI